MAFPGVGNYGMYGTLKMIMHSLFIDTNYEQCEYFWKIIGGGLKDFGIGLSHFSFKKSWAQAFMKKISAPVVAVNLFSR